MWLGISLQAYGLETIYRAFFGEEVSKILTEGAARRGFELLDIV